MDKQQQNCPSAKFNRNEYYNELSAARNSNGKDFCYNSDKIHNAVVMQFMFQYYKEIKMYCKHMSVLRKHFYESISDSDCNTEDLQQQTIDSLKSFLEKDGTTLTVIMTRNEVINDFVDKNLIMKYIELGKIVIKILPNWFAPRKYMHHFTIATDAEKNLIRSENNGETHSAVCIFDNSNSVNVYNNYYNTMLLYC